MPTPSSPALTPFLNPLPIPPVQDTDGTREGCRHFSMRMSEVARRLHSELPADTRLWGFNGSFPGPIIEVRSGEKIVVDWCNDLREPHLIQPRSDMPGGGGMPGAHCDASLPVRTSTHLHGGHTPAESDGHPLDFIGPGQVRHDTYTNTQPATLLWYHDHAMCVTRYNVYAGLAGPYLIRDDQEDALNLPRGGFEVPLIIQDRIVGADGQLIYYTSMGTPEFFGDLPIVNGVILPYLEVEPRKYRFRVLNGSNGRFLLLNFSNNAGFTQIGSDGGLLPAPVPRTSILLAPAERADLIVDFSTMSGNLILENKAPAPYPTGGSADIPQIMQFRVKTGPVADPSQLPVTLPPLPPLNPSGAGVRKLVLSELIVGGMHTTLINGMGFMDPITEAPVLGVPEIWEIYNTTSDAHPIHLHLTQFRLLDRQDATAPDPTTGELSPAGTNVEGPRPGEEGWKDTIIALPKPNLTRILATFTDYHGRYVWHCHILEHEENDMMRPLQVLPGSTGPMTM